MQIFDRRYFNLNKKFLIIIGLWPYETRMKITRRNFFMIIMLMQCIPLMAGIITHRDNTNRLLINIFGTLIGMCLCLKMLALIFAEKKMKVLVESIADNWSIIKDENEREILYEYSERGRKLTIYYVAVYVTTGVLVTLAPFISKILDTIYPLVEPRTKFYLREGEYFVNRDEYFLTICFSDVITAAFTTAVVVGIDTMYIVSSQHCCALYAIVRYRLLNLKRMGLDKSPAKDDFDSYDWMVQIIDLHTRALDFTSTLDNSFCLSFLLLLTTYFFVVPLLACAILVNYHNLLVVGPYVVYLIALAVNLFVLCWPGQIIYDHGSCLYEVAYNNEWYVTPLCTKKLLLIFIIRCSRPTILTAGRMMAINFETFSMIVRTALSYITVLASLI